MARLAPSSRMSRLEAERSVTTGFSADAAHIRDAGQLSATDIARATGADESTVRAWLRDVRSPSDERAERLAELAAIVERAALVMSRDYIAVWMRKPIGLLDDDKLLDVIAAGGYRRVAGDRRA